MNVKEQIFQKIKEYDRIMLFRHVRNDGDCVGATKGLKRILQLTWPEKEIYLIDADTAKYLDFGIELFFHPCIISFFVNGFVSSCS